MQSCFGKNGLVLKIDVVPFDGDCAAAAEKRKICTAYLLYNRVKLTSVILQLRRKDISLLTGHSLC